MTIRAQDSGEPVALLFKDEHFIVLALEVQVQVPQVRERPITVVGDRYYTYLLLDALEVQGLTGQRKERCLAGAF